jgi:hypothetical protein
MSPQFWSRPGDSDGRSAALRRALSRAQMGAQPRPDGRSAAPRRALSRAQTGAQPRPDGRLAAPRWALRDGRSAAPRRALSRAQMGAQSRPGRARMGAQSPDYYTLGELRTAGNFGFQILT